MKLLSHSSPEEKHKNKATSKEAEDKQPRVKRISKEERDKSGRYWGFVFLLITVLAATFLQIFKN